MEKQNLKLSDILNYKVVTSVHSIWSKKSPFANT